MLSQFIHLLTSTIYPSFPLVFSNNFPILGQANYSPSLSNTEAAYAAEKFGDTETHNYWYLKSAAEPLVVILNFQHSSQVLPHHMALIPSHTYTYSQK